MDYTTTKKHFDIFQKECEKWIEFFGLKDWDVSYLHDTTEGNRATLCYDLSNGWATISLSKKWGDNEITVNALKQDAFHEVSELLLARIRTLSRYRFTTKDEIEEAIHAIIRRMENSVFKKIKP